MLIKVECRFARQRTARQRTNLGDCPPGGELSGEGSRGVLQGDKLSLPDKPKPAWAEKSRGFTEHTERRHGTL